MATPRDDAGAMTYLMTQPMTDDLPPGARMERDRSAPAACAGCSSTPATRSRRSRGAAGFLIVTVLLAVGLGLAVLIGGLVLVSLA